MLKVLIVSTEEILSLVTTACVYFGFKCELHRQPIVTWSKHNMAFKLYQKKAATKLDLFSMLNQNCNQIVNYCVYLSKE